MKRGVLAVLVLALVVGVSPLAADPVIQRGIDVFTTTGSGTTYYSFADNPIPKGFFCKRSAAFAGRVTFKGLPLVTGIPGQLRGADTVIERLDDAVFNADGTAQTRIRVRALSLVSTAPLKTACGRTTSTSRWPGSNARRRCGSSARKRTEAASTLPWPSTPS
jgi:hypothetical protein